MLKERFKKFVDNPLVVFSHLRKYFFWTLIADKASNNYKSFTFLNEIETIEEITSKNISLIRVGDGTFGYLSGSSIYFNNWEFRYNRTFAKKLDLILKNGQNENILLCFPHQFILKTKQKFTKEKIENEWHIWITAKILLGRYLIPGHHYGSSFCFHPKHNPNIDFAALRKYISSKNVIIISSNVDRFADVKLGLSTTLIEAPSSDAWKVYESLEEKTLTTIKNNNWSHSEVLIMVSAAEAAKVIVFNLASAGYTAWDTGQFFDLAAKEFSTLATNTEHV